MRPFSQNLFSTHTVAMENGGQPPASRPPGQFGFQGAADSTNAASSMIHNMGTIDREASPAVTLPSPRFSTTSGPAMTVTEYLQQNPQNTVSLGSGVLSSLPSSSSNLSDLPDRGVPLQHQSSAPNNNLPFLSVHGTNASNVVSIVGSEQNVPSSAMTAGPSSIQGFVSNSGPGLPSGCQIRPDLPPAIQFRSLGHVGLPSVNLTTGSTVGMVQNLPRSLPAGGGPPLMSLQINQLLVPNLGSFSQPSPVASHIHQVPPMNPVLIGTLADAQPQAAVAANVVTSHRIGEQIVSQQHAPSPCCIESGQQDRILPNHPDAGSSEALNNGNETNEHQQPSSSLFSTQHEICNSTNMQRGGQNNLVHIATDFEPQPGPSSAPSVEHDAVEPHPSTTETVFFHKVTGKNIHIPRRVANLGDEDVSSPESANGEADVRQGSIMESCPTPNNEAEAAPDSTTHVTNSDFLGASISYPRARVRSSPQLAKTNVKYIQEDNDGVSSTSDDPYLMKPPSNLALHHFNSQLNSEVGIHNYPEPTSNQQREASPDLRREHDHVVHVNDPAVPSSSGILSNAEYEQVSENETDGLVEQSVPVPNEDDPASEPGPSNCMQNVTIHHIVQPLNRSLQANNSGNLDAACDSFNDQHPDPVLIQSLQDCYEQTPVTEPEQGCSSQNKVCEGSEVEAAGNTSTPFPVANNENIQEEIVLPSDQSFAQPIDQQDPTDMTRKCQEEHVEHDECYRGNVEQGTDKMFETDDNQHDDVHAGGSQTYCAGNSEDGTGHIENHQQLYQSDCLLSADRLYQTDSLVSPADMVHLQTSPQPHIQHPDITVLEPIPKVHDVENDGAAEQKHNSVGHDFQQGGALPSKETLEVSLSNNSLHPDVMDFANPQDQTDGPESDENKVYHEMNQAIQPAPEMEPGVSIPNNVHIGPTLISIPEVQTADNMFYNIKVHGDICVKDDTSLLAPSTSSASVSFPMPVVDPQQMMEQNDINPGNSLRQRSSNDDVVILVSRNSEGSIQAVNVEDQPAQQHSERTVGSSTTCVGSSEVSTYIDEELNRNQIAGTSQLSGQLSSLEVNIDQSQCIRVDGKKKWKCLQCPKMYTSRHNLVAHVLDHSGIKPFACNMCGKHFKQAGHLYQHILTHDNIKPYMCKVCSRCFTQGSHLKRHMAVHMDKRPHVCTICNHGFVYPSELKSHMEKHDTGVDNTCEHCNENLDTPKKLKQHLSTVHGNVADLTCKECGKVFPYPSQLKDHMVKHSGRRPYQCQQCKMEFLKEHHLKAHKFTHTGLRPFVCTLCTRAFNQKANLQRHMLIHQDKRQYKCEECNRSFTQPQVLKAHMVTHAYDKPFKCEECGKKFTRAHNLNGHMHIHRGSKPHVCFCGASFTLKGNLNRHKKEKHGIAEDRQCTDEEAAQILNEMSSRKVFDRTPRYPRSDDRRTKGSKKKRKSNPPRKTVKQVNQDEEVTAIWKQGSAPPVPQVATSVELSRPPEVLSFTNLTRVAPPPALPTQVPTEVFSQFIGTMATIPYQQPAEGFPGASFPVAMDVAMPEFSTVKTDELKPSPVQLLQEHLARKTSTAAVTIAPTMSVHKDDKPSKKGGKRGKKM